MNFKGGQQGALDENLYSRMEYEQMSSTDDHNKQSSTVNNTQQPGQHASDRMQNGYRENQGSGYDEEPHSSTQAPKDASERAIQGYDPTHSGVGHAKNHPGEHVNAPGRETGTAWGQDLQEGSTTDTPNRKNPAD